MMGKLESLGVRFDVQQRSKELIVTEKEKVIKDTLVNIATVRS